MVLTTPLTSPYITINANSVTGGTVTNAGLTYRVESWPTATVTTASNYGTDNGTTGSVVMEMNYIEYATLDTPFVQVARGPGYTVRVCRYDGANGCVTYPVKTPAERLKEILNSRMAPNVITTCRPLGYTNDIREIRARETLQRVLGEEKFKDFVRRGSVSVRAKSGLIYQIFPGHDFTNVYDRGKLVEKLCVVLQGGFPPTDSLIMRYLMILNNEQQFRQYAVKHGVYNPTLPAKPDQRTLVEIFKELKKVA